MYNELFLTLYRGDVVFRQSDNMLATMWLDNNVVTLLSDNVQPGKTEITRKQKDGKHLDVPCPLEVISYNSYMGGVDRGDQLRQYYDVRYKCHKYYKYIFWFLFDTSITNAFILLNHSKQNYTIKNFRIELAKALLGNYNSRKRRSIDGPSPSQRHIPVRHFPMEKHTGSKKGMPLLCQTPFHTSQERDLLVL